MIYFGSFFSARRSASSACVHGGGAWLHSPEGRCRRSTAGCRGAARLSAAGTRDARRSRRPKHSRRRSARRASARPGRRCGADLPECRGNRSRGSGRSYRTSRTADLGKDSGQQGEAHTRHCRPRHKYDGRGRRPRRCDDPEVVRGTGAGDGVREGNNPVLSGTTARNISP